MWAWLCYLLAWLSADPDALAIERSRCAGSVNVAYASLTVAEPPAPPAPAPKPAPPKPCTSAVASPTSGSPAKP